MEQTDRFARIRAEQEHRAARRQRRRWAADPDTPYAASAWARVPMADLFTEMGNTVVPGRGGTLECGHEPQHSSSSGRCVLIWPAEGRWYCRSCGQSGDAATLVMHQKGVGYRQAADDLTQRFGPPQERPSGARGAR